MSDEQDEARDAAKGEEQAVREQTAEMGKTAEEMEREVDELGGDIQDAKRTAAQRQDAPDPHNSETAGDWEGEAAGAGQGDDATDTAQTQDES